MTNQFLTLDDVLHAFDLLDKITKEVVNMYTQTDIAAITGVSQPELSQFVNGNKRFSYDRMLKILKRIEDAKEIRISYRQEEGKWLVENWFLESTK